MSYYYPPAPSGYSAAPAPYGAPPPGYGAPPPGAYGAPPAPYGGYGQQQAPPPPGYNYPGVPQQPQQHPPHHHHPPQHHQTAAPVNAAPAAAVAPTTINAKDITTMTQQQLKTTIHNMITSPTNGLQYRYHLRLIDDLTLCMFTDKRYSLSITPHASIDGMTQRVVTLAGLLPIMFRGQQYKTPIRVDFPLNYPDRAPLVYVCEQNGLKINPRCGILHQTTGEVYHPSLFSPQWNTNSTIHQALGILTGAFSESPPLYSPNPAAQEAARAEQEKLRLEQERKLQQQREDELRLAQEASAREEQERQNKQMRRDMEDFLSIKLEHQLKTTYNQLAQQITALNTEKKTLHAQVAGTNNIEETYRPAVIQYQQLSTQLDDEIAKLEAMIDDALRSDQNTNNTAVEDMIYTKSPTISNIEQYELEKFEEQFLEKINILQLIIKPQDN
eukprot:UN01333